MDNPTDTATSPKPIAYSVVVPVYNSMCLLSLLYRRLKATMEESGERFELIFVDDGSTDLSWPALREIAGYDPRVVAVQLTRNMGQGAATIVGLFQSDGEIVITIDDDLQYPPEDIPKLIAQIERPCGFEAVFGVPVDRSHIAWRRIASWTLNLLFSMASQKPFGLRFSGFRAMHRSVVQRLGALPYRGAAISALLFQLPCRIGMVRIVHSKSDLPSRHSLRKLLSLGLESLRSLSCQIRRRIVLGAAGLATIALVVGGVVSHFGQGNAIASALALLATILGTLIFSLLLAQIVSRAVAFRCKHPISGAIRHVIRGCQETSVNNLQSRFPPNLLA